MCKVSDKSEMVGEIIEWFDMELPTCESRVEGWHYDTFGLCQGDRRPAG